MINKLFFKFVIGFIKFVLIEVIVFLVFLFDNFFIVILIFKI